VHPPPPLFSKASFFPLPKRMGRSARWEGDRRVVGKLPSPLFFFPRFFFLFSIVSRSRKVIKGSEIHGIACLSPFFLFPFFFHTSFPPPSRTGSANQVKYKADGENDQLHQASFFPSSSLLSFFSLFSFASSFPSQWRRQ